MSKLRKLNNDDLFEKMVNYKVISIASFFLGVISIITAILIIVNDIGHLSQRNFGTALGLFIAAGLFIIGAGGLYWSEGRKKKKDSSNEL